MSKLSCLCLLFNTEQVEAGHTGQKPVSAQSHYARQLAFSFGFVNFTELHQNKLKMICWIRLQKVQGNQEITPSVTLFIMSFCMVLTSVLFALYFQLGFVMGRLLLKHQLRSNGSQM